MNYFSPATQRSVVISRMAALCAALAATLGASCAMAGSFEVAISPSRFELSAKSASRIGQTLDIFNVGNSASELSVRTLDWTYSADGNVGYVDELLPNSCRPWVTLERKILMVKARSKAAFRFQIDIPADAVRSECRFMLVIEGVEPAYKALVEGGSASLNLPVSGRLAITVYVAVNGAEPRLELGAMAVQDIKGKRVPMITVINTGDAHGRLEGSLDAVDSAGEEFELTPEGSPIMPGQTRTLALTTKAESGKDAITVRYPLKSNGMLEWEKGSFKVNAEFK